MRNILLVLSSAILLFACGEVAEQDPLTAAKSELAAKKSELKQLQTEVATLEEQVAELSPERVKKRRLVTVASLVKKDFEHLVEIQGTVQADKVVNASSETGGRIVQLNIKEGQYVSRGKLIAKMDTDVLNKSIAELETSMDLAQTTYERQQRLWQDNIGSEMQYLQAKNNKERLEKSMETLKAQLSKANVYAPQSGLVNVLYSKSGEMTSPGMPIAEILNLSVVKVAADVPEKYLGTVYKGKKVKVFFPALDKEVEAKVSLIGQTINSSNRTFKVEVLLNNRKKDLKPNLLANMMIKDFEQKDAIALPTELIQQDVNGRSYVYIKDQNEEGDYAKKIYITTGVSYQGLTHISEGLQGSENIILKGARSIVDGELIEVKGTEQLSTQG